MGTSFYEDSTASLRTRGRRAPWLAALASLLTRSLSKRGCRNSF